MATEVNSELITVIIFVTPFWISKSIALLARSINVLGIEFYRVGNTADMIKGDVGNIEVKDEECSPACLHTRAKRIFDTKSPSYHRHVSLFARKNMQITEAYCFFMP